MFNLCMISVSHSCCESVCIGRRRLPVCLRLPKPRRLLPNAQKNSSSECVLSFIGFSETQQGWLPQSQVERESSSSFLDA